MKTFRFTMAILAISLTAFLSCSKSDLTAPRPSSISASSSLNLDDFAICGDPVVYNLIDKAKVVQGTVSISNDETNLCVTLNITAPGFKLAKASLVIGTLAHVQAATNLAAWPNLATGPNPPDFTKTFSPQVTPYTFTIPLAGYEDCFYISVFGKLCKKDAYGKVIATDFIFLQSAKKTSTKCCQPMYAIANKSVRHHVVHFVLKLRVDTAMINGEPTQYLLDNFAGAFPGGITIGCATGFTLKMDNPNSIALYLPAGSTPEALDQNWLNDGPDNVLAGQVLTLALSVGFDLYDPNFGAGQQHLEDMIIGSGDFAGKTVGEFLTIANDVLGGCSNACTPSHVNAAATAINENYDSGTVDKGFLECPK